MYDLIAVVIHCGSGPNRGHYISIVKSHGLWLLFDDDIVDVSIVNLYVLQVNVHHCTLKTHHIHSNKHPGHLENWSVLKFLDFSHPPHISQGIELLFLKVTDSKAGFYHFSL